IFVSSHLLSEVEAMCDRVGVLARGRLVAEGPPGALRKGSGRLRIEVNDRPRAERVLAGLAGVTLDGGGTAQLRVQVAAPATAGGPPFFEQLRTNGLFGAMAGVGLIVPFFLPLGAGLLAGEAVVSEASGGTLRYLLVRPVGRVRLVLSKYGSVMALLAMSVLWV